MIQKPLNEIEWADLEQLRASGREEDDTIEFKAGFSGGPDYINFSDSQREKAIKGIAKEAIAFLNCRGGDIVIGAEEQNSDNPRIECFKPVPNASAVADRLAQSLSAVIEPHQSILGVRAIQAAESGEGVIIVRAPSSLRAPHRLTKDKECYIRRGRESVPMQMDEIQDLTLTRSTRTSEILRSLQERFSNMLLDQMHGQNLPNERFRIKMVYNPFMKGEIDLCQNTLSLFRHAKPDLLQSGRAQDYFSVLDVVHHSGRPVLRGRSYRGFRDRGSRWVGCTMTITNDLALEWDYIDSGRFDENIDQNKVGIYDAWIVGFIAKALLSLKKIQEKYQNMSHGILHVEIFVKGDQKLLFGSDRWSEQYDFLEGLHKIPDIELFKPSDVSSAFAVLQNDVYALAGVEGESVFTVAQFA
jgi:Putative DNA-binding domain